MSHRETRRLPAIHQDAGAPNEGSCTDGGSGTDPRLLGSASAPSDGSGKGVHSAPQKVTEPAGHRCPQGLRSRGLREAVLGVAGASQEALWASLGLLECLTSILRCISLQCLFWVFSCFPPLQCFILVSMLSFTSRVFLAGHLIWPSQSMREVEICLYPHGLDRFGGGV